VSMLVPSRAGADGTFRFFSVIHLYHSPIARQLRIWPLR
jgi:hypothetical protein